MKSDLIKHCPLKAHLLEGPLLEAQNVSLKNRLLQFISEETSEAVAIFSADQKSRSTAGDWYGEHVGKWLIASTYGYERTSDPDLLETMQSIVSFLGTEQEEDGYLGTYSPLAPCRFTNPESDSVRTWDIWVHAYMILGLLHASRLEGCEQALSMASKIGDLMIETFKTVPESVLNIGNHQGLSSGVLMEPLVLLSFATGNSSYADLARMILAKTKELDLPFLSAKSRNLDASQVGTGKIYQMLWCLEGILALYMFFGEPELLETVEYFWDNINEFHLNPAGGPWGGIAGHKEVFNDKSFFSPYGMVETCSIVSWLSLSRSLFYLTGESKYASTFEWTCNNALLGAMDKNGSDWIYFTFLNGRRNNTYHWACCKSSGAIGMELSSQLLASVEAETDIVHILQFQSMNVVVSDQASIRIEVNDSLFTLNQVGIPKLIRVLIPSWVSLSEVPQHLRIEGDYLVIPAEVPATSFPFQLKLKVLEKVDTIDHHGQEISRMDYACLTYGPYVFSTGLFDGFRIEESIRLPKLDPPSVFKVVSNSEVHMCLPGRNPVVFEPFYLTGGQGNGTWRITWLQVAWQ